MLNFWDVFYMFQIQGFIFQENGCIYSYGMVCFMCMSINSLLG